MSDGGKGSKQRPCWVSNIEYANRWDAIFAKDLNKKPELKEVVEYDSRHMLTEVDPLQKLTNINQQLGLYE